MFDELLADVNCAKQLYERLSPPNKKKIARAIKTHTSRKIQEGQEAGVEGHQAKSHIPNLEHQLHQREEEHEAVKKRKRDHDESLESNPETDTFWQDAANCPILAPVRAVLEAETLLLTEELAQVQALVVQAQAALTVAKTFLESPQAVQIKQAKSLSTALGLEVPSFNF